MSKKRYEASAKIVTQAITGLGQGKKGLANRLNKDPSLISRYACGQVQPKAETLIECIKLVEAAGTGSATDHSKGIYELVKVGIHNLSPENDIPVIQTIFTVLQLAKKI
ncbi:hypothetical protein [Zhongshania sp.]|uniref:hypothetical protein n=1 Tax=Zhongshania sp. TaxID=1971902 RepID=UPI002A835B55|nr:hypothetical protein [Zhongshania sp.]